MLKFHPKQGTILICDFNGLLEPEMVKKRPVVVVSPKLKHRDRLCTVVPLSTTQPYEIMPYHYELHDLHLPYPFDSDVCWAKCDMIYTVSFGRLSLFKNGRGPDGKRKYTYTCLKTDQMFVLADKILYGIGIHSFVK